MTEKNTFFATSNYFLPCYNFSSPPLPPLFTQAMAAKNITSPKAIFDPCTHEKKLFNPPTKKVVPMCGQANCSKGKVVDTNCSKGKVADTKGKVID